MPTYEYVCTECGQDLEVVQKFSDAPLTECPRCAGKLRKRYSPVGVVFKGAGFYKTDSRQKRTGTDEPAKVAASADGDGKPADTAAKPDRSDGKAGAGSARPPAGGDGAAARKTDTARSRAGAESGSGSRKEARKPSSSAA